MIEFATKDIQVTPTLVICLLVWLLINERKEKNDWIKKYHECAESRHTQAQTSQEKLHDTVRTLDKVLISKGIIAGGTANAD